MLSILKFAFTLGYIKGALSREETEKKLDSLTTVPELVKECYEEEENIKKIAQEFKDAKSCFFLGRGINVPTALEGSLKMKEISYIHSEAFPAAEMKHGPIALLEDGFPVVTIIPKNDPIYEKILSNVQEVKARSAKVVALVQRNDHEVANFVDHVIRVPEVPDYLQAIVFSIPLQLLAYYTALARGCEIDQPRNLAKSVTVE